MSFLPSMPKASLLDVFKAYPELAAPIHEFAEALMRGPSPFSEGERELIAAYVSSMNHCEYCRNSHTAVAERFGVASELVDDLLRDVETAAVPERLRPVMGYVKKLNDAPGEVGEADVRAILEVGWDETAVVHAALVCGHFNLMNRWVDGLGIESRPQMVRMASEQLHARGYQGVRALLDD
jgi:uncharacterized peroxidase-related enzyme